MSQEFEKIVLEKLHSMDEKLDKHTEILNEHTEVLNEHTKVLKEHTEQIKKVRRDIYQINKQLIKSAQKMEDIEEVVEYNTQIIEKYNEENSKKIDISLKAYEQLCAKVKINECMISNLKSKDFQKDIRITALEDQIKNISITA